GSAPHRRAAARLMSGIPSLLPTLVLRKYFLQEIVNTPAGIGSLFNNAQITHSGRAQWLARAQPRLGPGIAQQGVRDREIGGVRLGNYRLKRTRSPYGIEGEGHRLHGDHFLLGTDVEDQFAAWLDLPRYAIILAGQRAAIAPCGVDPHG